MIPEHFRGEAIPAYIKSKTQLVAYVLTRYMGESPISNWEFVAESYTAIDLAVLYITLGRKVIR